MTLELNFGRYLSYVIFHSSLAAVYPSVLDEASSPLPEARPPTPTAEQTIDPERARHARSDTHRMISLPRTCVAQLVSEILSPPPP